MDDLMGSMLGKKEVLVRTCRNQSIWPLCNLRSSMSSIFYALCTFISFFSCCPSGWRGASRHWRIASSQRSCRVGVVFGSAGITVCFIRSRCVGNFGRRACCTMGTFWVFLRFESRCSTAGRTGPCLIGFHLTCYSYYITNGSFKLYRKKDLEFDAFICFRWAIKNSMVG